jgi:hypothetical protein
MNVSISPFISFQIVFIINKLTFPFLSKKNWFAMLFSICFKEKTNTESFDWILSRCSCSWITYWYYLESFRPFTSWSPWVDTKILFIRRWILWKWLLLLWYKQIQPQTILNIPHIHLLKQRFLTIYSRIRHFFKKFLLIFFNFPF